MSLFKKEHTKGMNESVFDCWILISKNRNTITNITDFREAALVTKELIALDKEVPVLINLNLIKEIEKHIYMVNPNTLYMHDSSNPERHNSVIHKWNSM